MERPNESVAVELAAVRRPDLLEPVADDEVDLVVDVPGGRLRLGRISVGVSVAVGVTVAAGVSVAVGVDFGGGAQNVTWLISARLPFAFSCV